MNGVIHGIVAKRNVDALFNILFSSLSVRFDLYVVRNTFSTFSFFEKIRLENHQCNQNQRNN